MLHAGLERGMSAPILEVCTRSVRLFSQRIDVVPYTALWMKNWTGCALHCICDLFCVLALIETKVDAHVRSQFVLLWVRNIFCFGHPILTPSSDGVFRNEANLV